jgi:hypothetical protein
MNRAGRKKAAAERVRLHERESHLTDQEGGLMAVQQGGQRRSVDRLLALLTTLSPLGLIGLIFTGLLGFEEPPDALLLVSFALVIAAPVAICAHIAFTTELTPEDRRVWARELLSVRAGVAVSEYLSSEDRSAAARRRAHEARARQHKMPAIRTP